jgi:hypothetical protein
MENNFSSEFNEYNQNNRKLIMERNCKFNSNDRDQD